MEGLTKDLIESRHQQIVGNILAFKGPESTIEALNLLNEARDYLTQNLNTEYHCHIVLPKASTHDCEKNESVIELVYRICQEGASISQPSDVTSVPAMRKKGVLLSQIGKRPDSECTREEEPMYRDKLRSSSHSGCKVSSGGHEKTKSIEVIDIGSSPSTLSQNMTAGREILNDQEARRKQLENIPISEVRNSSQDGKLGAEVNEKAQQHTMTLRGRDNDSSSSFNAALERSRLERLGSRSTICENTGQIRRTIKPDQTTSQLALADSSVRVENVPQPGCSRRIITRAGEDQLILFKFKIISHQCRNRSQGIHVKLKRTDDGTTLYVSAAKLMSSQGSKDLLRDYIKGLRLNKKKAKSIGTLYRRIENLSNFLIT